MYAKVQTAVLYGIDGVVTGVEADLHNGLPVFHLVGLPDASVREARERIHAAIVNSGYRFPAKRITVNLSPASLKKEGSHLDLPIAVSMLAAMGEIKEHALFSVAFLGELSLDGRLCRVNGIVPLLLGLLQGGIQHVVIPKDNLKESKILKNVRLLPLEHLSELASFLNEGKSSFLNFYTPSVENYREDTMNFSDVYGQELAKRVIEIGAAGRHNMLFVGPPGSGKTMLAKRIPTVLPILTEEERLEVTKIYSAAGLLTEQDPMVYCRPFRQPHHTASAISLVGGGHKPRPGELSLAHKGVLFLDEIPEFARNTLEVLRQPMEQGTVHISRANSSLHFPADFMLVAAMNPCPCGYLGQTEKCCTCTPAQVQRYAGKLSGPLMDRIDLQAAVESVDYEYLAGTFHNPSQSNPRKAILDSYHMGKNVEAAAQIQSLRYQGEPISFNSQLSPSQVHTYCSMSKGAKLILKRAFKQNMLSARGYYKIIKVARTIADLEGADRIDEGHMAEAIGYRCWEKQHERW